MTTPRIPVGFPCGTRVRLVKAVEYYPLGIWPVGTTGTVVGVLAPDKHPAGGVLLDEHFEALDEWHNILQVCSADEDPDATWANWEAIP